MTAKASSRPGSPLVSRTLKVVGVIMILSFLVDTITSLIPFQVSNKPWLIATLTQMVDRGIIPMIGMALLFAAYWFEANSGAGSGRKSWQDLRLWASILASLLGLIYLIIIFLHPNTVRLNQQQTLDQINQQATQAESQLETRLTTEVNQQRALANQLIAASDDQLNQAVQGGAITQEQATQIRQFKQNPESLDPYLQERAGQLRTQLQTEIRAQRQQTEQAAKTDAIKSGLRVGISSLLLAIGFITIGWTGLKSLGAGQNAPSRRSA
jgi:hypothetical protein